MLLFVVRIPLLLQLHISVAIVRITILNFVHFALDGLVFVISILVTRMFRNFGVAIYNMVFWGINARFVVIHDCRVLVYVLIACLVWVVMRTIQVITARAVVVIAGRMFDVILPTLSRTSYPRRLLPIVVVPMWGTLTVVILPLLFIILSPLVVGVVSFTLSILGGPLGFSVVILTR